LLPEPTLSSPDQRTALRIVALISVNSFLFVVRFVLLSAV
jgi:hypothetical protein